MTVPVSMLWEDVDADATLADRFGFADGAAATAWLTHSLHDAWGLEITGCDSLVLSAGNGLAWLSTRSGPRIAKWSVVPQRFARLRRAVRVTNWLGDQGVPVSVFHPTLAGPPHVETAGNLLTVQHVVSGKLVCVEDLDQVFRAGSVLAELHGALARSPETVEPPDPRFGALPDFVAMWLDATPPAMPAAEISTLRALVAAAPELVSAPQWVHGDYRSANILMAPDGSPPTVAAVLDLEELQVDHPVNEVARAAVLLGTRYRDWAPVSARVHARFRAGYESLRPFNASEDAWWDVLVLWHQLNSFSAGVPAP